MSNPIKNDTQACLSFFPYKNNSWLFRLYAHSYGFNVQKLSQASPRIASGIYVCLNPQLQDLPKTSSWIKPEPSNDSFLVLGFIPRVLRSQTLLSSGSIGGRVWEGSTLYSLVTQWTHFVQIRVSTKIDIHTSTCSQKYDPETLFSWKDNLVVEDYRFIRASWEDI